MHQSFVVALLAAGALAAPHGHHSQSKESAPESTGNFKIPVNRPSSNANTEMDTSKVVSKIFAKYDWSMVPPSADGSSPVEGLAPSKTVFAGHGSASAPAHAVRAAKQEATVAATPEQGDTSFLSPVTIGGQTLTLDFDTGSADFWVFSTELGAAQSAGHTVFDPSKSSTWKQASGLSWKISYGDGSTASGNVGYDNVQIGGITATSQAVEVATQLSDSFVKDTQNDGLVGLGFNVVNTVTPTKQKTFFDNIMNNLDQPVFTADLKDGSSSTYEFGLIDTSKYTGDIHWTTVDPSKGFWEFPSTSYQINGVTYQNANAKDAIADTGTSLLLVDAVAVQAYYSQVPGSSSSAQYGGYIFPCNAKLPSFGVALGNSGFYATIPGSALIYSKIDAQNCFGGVQSGAGAPNQVFGDILLKQYFAVFNGGNKSFGLAQKSS